MRHLRSGALAVVLLGLAALIGCNKTDLTSTPAEDEKKLDGTWKVVSRTEGDKDASAAKSPPLKLEEAAVVVIDRGVLTTKTGTPLRLKLTFPEGKHVDLVEVDEKNKPVQSKKDAEPMTEYRYKGTYKLDGDTLTITLAGENVKDRPAEVGSKGKGHYTVVLKRTTDGKAGDGPKEKEQDKNNQAKDREEKDKKDNKQPPKSDFGEK